MYLITYCHLFYCNNYAKCSHNVSKMIKVYKYKEYPSLEHVINSSLFFGCQQPAFNIAVWP